MKNEVTKEAIQRLQASEITVALWNGCYNIATATAVFAKYRLELRVSVTHPLLEWPCGAKNGTELIRFEGCRGVQVEVSPDLDALVMTMKEKATLTTDEALMRSKSFAENVNHTMKELGIHSAYSGEVA